MTTVSIRLSEGLYRAIGELAAKVGVDKSDITTLLLYMGFDSIRPDVVSKEALALIWADTMESYVSVVRALARIPPGKRKDAEKSIQELVSKIATLIALPSPTTSSEVKLVDGR